MKGLALFLSVATLVMGVNHSALAKNDKAKGLPPGLQKKVEQGKSLPPGWQKKLAVGDVFDRDEYRRGSIISRDGGVVTMKVESGIFRVIENTREIIEILK